ncbi:MAG: hypothetical protein JWO58_2543 [Chitinophagaceae bacterium]|nr:hypothetical protein [Chitinophagaceae bacterium]
MLRPLTLDYTYHVRHVKDNEWLFGTKINPFNITFDRTTYINWNSEQDFEDHEEKYNTNGFPYEVFPPSIQDFITETNTCLNFPIDFIGVSVLYAISVATGNTHKVEFKNGWYENSVLYLTLVGSPGTNKSHPLSFAIAPLLAQDEINNFEYQELKKVYDIEFSTAKKKKDGSENRIIKPIRKKIIITDFTTEALANIHHGNQKGIGVYADEFAGWFKNFNRYKGGSEMEFWLSCWSGKAINVDRVSAESIYISSSSVSVIGTIQNKVLKELAGEGRSNNGFIDRILFAIPENLKKPYWDDREVSSAVIAAWTKAISNLLTIPLETNNRGVITPEILRFGEDAKKLLKQWQVENTDDANDSDDEIIKGLHSKMEIYILRFSLILEMSKFACNESDIKEISLDSVNGAIKLAKYFYNSTIKVYSIISGTKVRDRVSSKVTELHKTLPDSFTTDQGWHLAQSMGIAKRSYHRYLNIKSLVRRVRRGEYQKTR